MNFEAFQAQQKALKDEERKRQKAASENLQGYRGGVSADDAKLTALREAERKAKAEAETGLHGYRGTLSEEEKKLLALKEEERRQRASTLHGSQAELVIPSKDMDSFDAITPGAVSVMADKFSDGAAEKSMVNGGASMNGTSTAEALPVSNGLDATDSISKTGIDGQNILAHNKNLVEPSSEQIEVEFYFGLITESETPNFEGYMSCVTTVLQSLASNDSTISNSIKFDEPKITNAKLDDKYINPGKKRFLVTVAVPLTTANMSTGSEVKAKVISTVRQAVRDGSFRL